jgi:Protein of unknown function (DUF3054)
MGRGTRNVIEAVTVGRGWGLLAAAFAADLCAVGIYVLVGRISHDESLSAAGLLGTGWPFIVGLIGGYIGVIMIRWSMLSVRGCTVIVVKTLIIGLVLRYGLQHDGTPFSFIAVTALVLTALTFGWRFAVRIPLKRTDGPLPGALPSR